MMERACCGQAASLSELSRVIWSQVCWPGWRGLRTTWLSSTRSMSPQHLRSPSLPDANLRYLEAFDWRKWTKGGCSFLLLSAQFWSSCHGTCRCKKLGILVLPSRSIFTLPVQVNHGQWRWHDESPAGRAVYGGGPWPGGADRRMPRTGVTAWPLPPGCSVTVTGVPVGWPWFFSSFRWLRESRSVASVSQAKTWHLKLRLERLQVELERECH